MHTLAKKLRDFLQENRKNVDLHLIRRFPFNACETSSLILGKIFAENYPDKIINFVKGTNSDKYENHFWIEVDDFVFDITADQFDDINAPIMGIGSEMIFKRFDQVEKTHIQDELNSNDFALTQKNEFVKISKLISKT